MSILKWLLVFTYLLWVLVAVSALLNPTIKSLIPLIICSTSVIVAVVIISHLNMLQIMNIDGLGK